MRYKNWIETVNGEEVHIILVPAGWESGFAHALTLAGYEEREWFAHALTLAGLSAMNPEWNTGFDCPCWIIPIAIVVVGMKTSIVKPCSSDQTGVCTMLFLTQIAMAQIAIVRFYGKVASSLYFKVLCGMLIAPFVAISIVVLSIACLPLLLVTLFVVGLCALAYGLIYHRGQNRSVAIVERSEEKSVPSVEYLLADHSYTLEGMLADARWQIMKDLIIAQYEYATPSFKGTTIIPESQFWTNCQPVQQILFREDDLIETSVDIAVLPKRELFALAKSHGLKVSGKGRTLDVIRAELYKVMYGK